MKAARNIILIGGMMALVIHCQAMLTFNLNGHISGLNLNESEGGFSVGQSWTIEINYDENTPDSTQWSGEWTGGIDSDETRGNYTMIDFRFVTEGLALETNNINVEISNDRTAIELPSEQIIVFDSISFNPSFGGSAPDFTGNLYSFTLGLMDRDSDVFDSDALPISTPDLNLFESSAGSLSWLNGLGGESISLQTTSLAIVPEPNEYPLLVGLMSMTVIASSRLRMKERLEPVGAGQPDNPPVKL